jgi:hypothetical protein
MPSILQKQTTRETDPLTLRGDLANTVIPVLVVVDSATTTLSDGEASVGHYILKVPEVGNAINNNAFYTIQCATGETFGNGSIDADTYEVDVSITTNGVAQSHLRGVGTIEAAITANNKIMIRRAGSQITQILEAATVNLRLKKREFDLDALAA